MGIDGKEDDVKYLLQYRSAVIKVGSQFFGSYTRHYLLFVLVGEHYQYPPCIQCVSDRNFWSISETISAVCHAHLFVHF